LWGNYSSGDWPASVEMFTPFSKQTLQQELDGHYMRNSRYG
jgi:hypothetical protein